FRKDIIIEVYNEAGQLALAYKVFRCWVSEFQALPDLDANANAVAIQHIKLENEGWERDYEVTEPSEPSFNEPAALVMRPLAASDILKVWEQGEKQPAVDRALTMLAFACPELSDTELAELSIGQRDARLMELRELTFGSRVDGLTTCERCRIRVEF